MELGSHIKARRAELGISQDELAGRIYVSRQTISSWENDKTYPDVQSLLLLSQVFDTTIDELVRGDMDTMKETVEKDARLVKRLSYVMVAFLALMLLAMVWWTYQVSIADLPLVQTLPTVVLAVVLWGIAMFASVWVDRIKREHDLVTYQEVLAFWNGEPVDRDTERGRRERLIPRWMKVVRVAGFALIGVASPTSSSSWASSSSSACSTTSSSTTPGCTSSGSSPCSPSWSRSRSRSAMSSLPQTAT